MIGRVNPLPLKLLALPCAGASATMYLRWRRWLPHWVELLPLELPGRGGRIGDAFIEDFEALVLHLVQRHADCLQGRYVLFGHSMGALLAYGLAQHQHRLGERVPLGLIVSGSPAPSMREPSRFADKRGDAALMAELRKQGGTPEEVFAHPELLRLTLDTLAADYRVCESFCYRPLPALSLPLQILAGRQDDIAAHRIEAWSKESTLAASLDWFDGGHFFIRAQERAVLATLASALARMAAGGWYAASAVA
ncbi:UNVERIFIED_ORG: surfactin synthase thioesterase subunit [Herbaspirillum seropedicae]